MDLPALDHLVVDVGDRIDEAAATYRALGFQLTERGRHTLGSVNHLAMFGTNYLELLGIGLPGGRIRQELAGFPEGLNGLVLATDDADSRYRDLKARGLQIAEPRSFSRPVTLDGGAPGGVTRDASFRTTHLAASEVPFGRLYFCQHDTRDLVWRPEWQRHPNGASEIVGLLIGAQDPSGVAALFTRMFDAAPAALSDGGGRRFDAGGVALDIVGLPALEERLGTDAPQAARRPAFIAAVIFRTSSLDAAARVLRGVPGLSQSTPPSGQLRVPASSACNVALEFIE